MPSLKVSLRQDRQLADRLTPRPRTALDRPSDEKPSRRAASPSVTACQGRLAATGLRLPLRASPRSASSRSPSTSPMSRRRRLGSSSRQRLQQCSDARRASPVGMRSQRARPGILLAVRRLSSEGRLPRQHLEADASERPDIRALVDEVTARLLRTHVRRGAQDESVRPAATPAPSPSPDPSAAADFARPKSRIFVVPSLAILMLDGFRSRCTIPR